MIPRGTQRLPLTSIATLADAWRPLRLKLNPRRPRMNKQLFLLKKIIDTQATGKASRPSYSRLNKKG